MATGAEEPGIRFDDGEGYEQMMGVWSQLAGTVFLDWIAPAKGLRWVDVGCGNGAFTDLFVTRCEPSSVDAIDPSEGQLAYARKRAKTPLANFVQGNAMALPYGRHTFDVAVMGLVLFFVPDPAKGVAEMKRVTVPGGTVAAYAWDIRGGGFPLEMMMQEMRGVGVEPLLPPSTDAAKIDNMRALWNEAGLVDVETREITVQRTYADFEEYWNTTMRGSNLSQPIKAMSADVLARFEQSVRRNTPVDRDGRVTLSARANAVKGRAP